MNHFKRLQKFKLSCLALSVLMMISWTGNHDKNKNDELKIPVTYYKLNNGLKVVLSQDSTAPTIAIGVYYNIGFRIEPKNRTGFAHLFEHMMFQGSQNLARWNL